MYILENKTCLRYKIYKQSVNKVGFYIINLNENAIKTNPTNFANTTMPSQGV